MRRRRRRRLARRREVPSGDRNQDRAAEADDKTTQRA